MKNWKLENLPGNYVSIFSIAWGACLICVHLFFELYTPYNVTGIFSIGLLLLFLGLLSTFTIPHDIKLADFKETVILKILWQKASLPLKITWTILFLLTIISIVLEIMGIKYYKNIYIFLIENL